MSTFAIRASIVTAPWMPVCEAYVVDPSFEQVSYEGKEYDLTELTWTTLGLDWRKMNNNSSTLIGENKWVVSGYDDKGRAAVVIVEKLKGE